MKMNWLSIVTALFLVSSFSMCLQDELTTKTGHQASIVYGDKSIDVPCDDTFVKLLIAIAQEAGNFANWEEQDDAIEFTNFVTFSSKAFGPYKAHLGSRGFSGIRSITVEIGDPHRVSISDAGKIYISKLPKDSTLILAIKVLWQTARSLKDDPT